MMYIFIVSQQLREEFVISMFGAVSFHFHPNMHVYALDLECINRSAMPDQYSSAICMLTPMPRICVKEPKPRKFQGL